MGDSEGNITQAEMNGKSFDDLEKANKKLESLYIEYENILKMDNIQGEVALFHECNAHWAEFIYYEGFLAGRLYEGGTIQPLIINERRLYLTQQRIIDLTQIIKDRNSNR